MADSYGSYQQPYAQQVVPQKDVIESASATTSTTANVTGPAAYVIFVVAVVLLCVLFSRAGTFVGTAFGEVMSEVYEEYGDELPGYEDIEGLMGDDPVSPDFTEILEGETEDA